MEFSPSPIITLSIGPSPGSASMDIGEDLGGGGDGRVEVMLWINLVAAGERFGGPPVSYTVTRGIYVRETCHNPASSSWCRFSLTPVYGNTSKF
jgi:hypothetical protein